MPILPLGDYMNDDFIMHVDRGVHPVYPEHTKPMHPDLECTGPAVYDLRLVELWRHEGQKKGVVPLLLIYNELNEKGLETCLGLQDGLAIVDKGVEVFRRCFTKEIPYLWKSVVQNRYGLLYVPRLAVLRNKPIIEWCQVKDSLAGNRFPALRHSDVDRSSYMF